MKRDLKRGERIAVSCSTEERLFTRYRWHYALARTRFIGLAKNATVVGLAAVAANIGKSAGFLTLYDLPEPNDAFILIYDIH